MKKGQYWKNKHRSEETKEKIREKLKGIHPKSEFQIGHIPWNKGLHICLSPTTRFKKGDIRLIGKNNHNYIDGKSHKPYTKEFNVELKEQIRKRDNYICQRCNKKQSTLKGYFKKLDIHHIDYDKENLDPTNLITLCMECNIKVNFNRDYWYAYFKYIMEVKK